MRSLRDSRGFTLGEVLVATAATTLVAGAAYALLVTALDQHERLGSVHRAVNHGAHVADVLRSDVATMTSIDLVQPTSLMMTAPNGKKVLYDGTVNPDGSIEVNRHRIDGGSVEDTILLTTLYGGLNPAKLEFTAEGADRVRVEMVSSDLVTLYRVSRWAEP